MHVIMLTKLYFTLYSISFILLINIIYAWVDSLIDVIAIVHTMSFTV